MSDFNLASSSLGFMNLVAVNSYIYTTTKMNTGVGVIEGSSDNVMVLASDHDSSIILIW